MGIRFMGLGLLIYFVGVSPSLAAQSNRSDSRADALGRHLLVGGCDLKDDPSVRTPSGPVLCIRGKIGVASVISSGPKHEDIWGKYADGSLGVYLTSWISLYGRAREREFRRYGPDASPDRYRDAEYAVLSLGNPVLHKVRLNAGQMRPPFGIDRPDVDEFYRLSEDRRFWPGPTSTVALTLDDLRATELDIGFARYKNELNLEQAILNGEYHDVITARLMRDFAGNGGTRLVLSGGVDSSGSRLYGAGFINQAPNKDQLVLEVVRRLPQPDGSSLMEEPVTQVLRIGFTGHYDHDARWIFHFDDERDRFRRGLVEFNYRIMDYLILRIGASYRINIIDRSNDDSRWSMISGFEGRL